MPKVALVETKPSKTRFSAEFDGLEFDQYQLCSDPTIKKVLKRDCDIDMTQTTMTGSFSLVVMR